MASCSPRRGKFREPMSSLPSNAVGETRGRASRGGHVGQRHRDGREGYHAGTQAGWNAACRTRANGAGRICRTRSTRRLAPEMGTSRRHMAFGSGPGCDHGRRLTALVAHVQRGAQARSTCRKLVSGDVDGPMQLTEPQARLRRGRPCAPGPRRRARRQLIASRGSKISSLWRDDRTDNIIIWSWLAS